MRYSQTITIEDLETDPFPHYARLRAEDPIAPVPAANCWFASEPAPGTAYSFVGCTVSPGFDFRDFELASKSGLSTQFPSHSQVINEMTRIP